MIAFLEKDRLAQIQAVLQRIQGLDGLCDTVGG
jgi:hypothetical protein